MVELFTWLSIADRVILLYLHLQCYIICTGNTFWTPPLLVNAVAVDEFCRHYQIKQRK